MSIANLSISLVKLLLSFLQVENIRRKHNYLPLIMEVLKILAKRGELVNLVEKVREAIACSVISFHMLSLSLQAKKKKADDRAAKEKTKKAVS